MTTNVTYANAYSALCNNKSGHLHLWSFWIANKQLPYPRLQDMNVAGSFWKALPAGGRCTSDPVGGNGGGLNPVEVKDCSYKISISLYSGAINQSSID